MQSPTVLIADDDTAMLRLLRAVLEPMGVIVSEARNAVSALVQINQAPPNLVILDVNMPAGNGLCVCEMLSTDNRLSRVPVIVLTSDSDDRTRTRCESMRAHYIRKGVDAMEQVKRFACEALSLNFSDQCVAEMYG